MKTMIAMLSLGCFLIPSVGWARTGRSDDAVRLQGAARYLGKSLSPKMARSILRAHRVGSGQLGRDGKTPAGILANGKTNYTLAQLLKKARILSKAGLSKPEIRKLMDHGTVGNFFGIDAPDPFFEHVANNPCVMGIGLTFSASRDGTTTVTERGIPNRWTAGTISSKDAIVSAIKRDGMGFHSGASRLAATVSPGVALNLSTLKNGGQISAQGDELIILIPSGNHAAGRLPSYVDFGEHMSSVPARQTGAGTELRVSLKNIPVGESRTMKLQLPIMSHGDVVNRVPGFSFMTIDLGGSDTYYEPTFQVSRVAAH